MNSILPPFPNQGACYPGGLGRPTKVSAAAVASLVFGLLSCVLSLLAGIPAIIFGTIGLRAISRSKQSGSGPLLTGNGMALTGLVMGGMSCVITPVLVGLLVPAVQSAREAANRATCSSRLKMVGLGMHMFASAHGDQFPKSIVDRNGRPLLSWRVAILPYLEEESLYEEFHLDEPWDSPHNRGLISRMPSVYRCPSAADDTDGTTTYLGAACPGAYLDSKTMTERTLALADGAFAAGASRVGGDGMPKTILIVEVAPEDAVPWTAPQEFDALPRDAAAVLFKNSQHSGKLHMAAFADGSVRSLGSDIDPAVLAALLTFDGGESVSSDF